MKSSENQFKFAFVRVWAFFGLALFASTWKLWTPQTRIPQIPFFECLVLAPPSVDWICLTGVAISLSICIFSKPQRLAKFAVLTFAVSVTGLIALNQHRLQPWAYQWLVFAVLILSLDRREALFWMRMIVVSIYFYSAISKFDYQFIHTVGEQFLTTLASLIGLDAGDWSPTIRRWLIVGFPLGELGLAAGLFFQKTRTVAMLAAIAMHAVLVLILGPPGLNHHAGVVVWNLYFIVQAILLFSPQAEAYFGVQHELKIESAPTSRAATALSILARLTAIVVLVIPLTQPLGFCDHWLAWELYAPRSSRAELAPASAIPNSQPANQSLALSLADQSLDQLAVPIYPQARFQLAALVAMQRKHPELQQSRIELKQKSDRWTGTRESQLLTHAFEQKIALQKYWLNTRAREIFFNDQ